MAQVKEGFIPNAHLRGEIMNRWRLLSTTEIEEACIDRSKHLTHDAGRYWPWI